MNLTRLAVANRGEIAIRIARAAGDLSLATVVMAPEDDLGSLHTRHGDALAVLPGRGADAYLDPAAVIEAALRADADAVHPGYGFLAERTELAQACDATDLTFVGPTPAQLQRFGDKVASRELAEQVGVPGPPGTGYDPSPTHAFAFLAEHRVAMIKAVGGGGGRGMRTIRRGDDLAAAIARSRREADTVFGDDRVYLEALIERVRHVEVQIVGDGREVVHLGERECSLQRQHQKLVERAPSPSIDRETRRLLTDSAVAIASAVDYRSIGTVEFLVGEPTGDDPPPVYFLEVNARLQVEHTVTEAVTGVDLVHTQLRLADGATLEELGLTADRVAVPNGHAIQVRVNAETMTSEGRPRPSGGTLSVFETPSGPGIRTDTYGYVGYTTNPGFDSLLAKVVAWAPGADPSVAVRRVRRALEEFRVEGVSTNLGFVLALLDRPEVHSNEVTTSFVMETVTELLAAVTSAPTPTGVAPKNEILGPVGSRSVDSPLQGTVVAVSVEVDDGVAVGQPLIILESMKMEHEVGAPITGVVREITVAVGDLVSDGHPMVFVEPADTDIDPVDANVDIDAALVRPDLAELFERRGYGLDENRPDAVAARRSRGHRTARENLARLVDPGSFVEFGRLMIAAQRGRRQFQDLLENTPGDGMVAGIGSVNGDSFTGRAAQTVVMSYDYMVLAGTQGGQNHRKKDRLFEMAARNRLPVVVYAEGGGGRPGDTDGIGGSGLDCLAFSLFAELSGLVPLVGIANGRCFAGNAVLLGCCDVIIATEGSNIGIGGPAMVEGGGLGAFTPEEIGPSTVQVSNGVIDVLVADEDEATDVAKRYLSYFQGATSEWEVGDQNLLRHLVPANRKRTYEMRAVIDTLCDVDSVLELRSGWGRGVLTALGRIEGRPIGVVANSPNHLGGAIDAAAADKAARFMQLCDAHDIPLLFLCDTPGIMVGPAAEHEATIRHAARMFVTSASVDVPIMTIVTRKGYGLGAQAMAGGSFKATSFTVSWPTGEFGGMGLEGFVRLGYRKELEAIDDPEERQEAFEARVARLYDSGKAVNAGTFFEVDDVIDPAESRRWVLMALQSAPPLSLREGKKRGMIDTW